MRLNARAKPSGLSGRRKRMIEPVYVIRKTSLTAADPFKLHLTMPDEMPALSFQWRLETEQGQIYDGTGTLPGLSKPATGRAGGKLTAPQGIVPVPAELDLGYHRLSISFNAESTSQAGRSLHTVLIVVPDRCFVPFGMATGKTLWGPAVCLAGLRSETNWGIGDFTDLKEIARWCASAGAGFLAVEPLHPLSAWPAVAGSTPSFSSTMCLNALYIDVEAVFNFAEAQEVKRLVLSPAFQARLQRLREEALVDYHCVAAEKQAILKMLYQHFREHYLNKDCPANRSFREFQKLSGTAGEQFARYEALSEWLKETYPGDSSSWPEIYQDPGSRAVEEFAAANGEKIEFYQYLQWQADLQLGEIGKCCLNNHLPVGLVLTLSNSVDCPAADVWARQLFYARQSSDGAGDGNTISKTWGAAPEILPEDACGSFVASLRLAMQHAGALSIENIIALKHRFCLPPGRKVVESTYVQYSFDDLLGIIALESHRNRCMVIGKDLATSPDSLRNDADALAALEKWGILTHKIFSVEKDASQVYRQPEAYPSSAFVTFGGDDMPSLTQYWSGLDLSSDGQCLDKELRDRLVSQRILERMDLLRLLEQESLLPEGVTVDPASTPVMTRELAVAVYSAMARTPSMMVAFNFEDLLDPSAPPEFPEVQPGYRKWLCKQAMDLHQLLSQEGVQLLVKQLNALRGLGCPPQMMSRQPAAARFPLSTYRLQFNKDFTLAQATALVPYLAKLGVSHCYASPLLRAQPGSLHGYDIVHHNELNPEIGSRDDLDKLVFELRRHNMGLILDFVPNHMGVGKDNPWWSDVLENGPASEFADYFDIDWEPVKEELKGKVLLPILGDSYGQCLTSGQLKLCFAAGEGKLIVQYFNHEFPINPKSYPLVLGHRLDTLKERLGASSLDVMEYQSILAALERLPGHVESIGFAERRREKRLQIMRLAALCSRNEEIARFIQQNVNDFQCQTDDPSACERLHALLQAQAYRLANWRVASDEINYRRFFDVNNLAALRVEDARVFAEMHQLILDLIAAGQLDGLRIDHPDGLYDPSDYFLRLQSHAAGALNMDFEAPDADKTLNCENLPIYLVAEKILASFEHLEQNFTVHGTTGYDFLSSVTQLLVASGNEKAITDIYDQFAGRQDDYEQMKQQCKELILTTVLNGELHVLAHQLNEISESSWFFRDYTFTSLRHALAQVVSYFPVYRTYVKPGYVDRTARDYVAWAVKQAKRHSMALDTTIYDFISNVLLLEPMEGVFTKGGGPDASDLRRAIEIFAMKFQQFTGPVMAKSMEDTLFYRYNRLVCLNEVGGDPQRFGISAKAFHHHNQERQRWRPYELLATSTHDTKRSEDVRARLAVLSEIPGLWRQKVTLWAELNSSLKETVDEMPVPDANVEYLLYQTLVGACPPQLSAAGDIGPFRERVKQYMLKAAREAKIHTSWINQMSEYEESMSSFVEQILTPSGSRHNQFLDDLIQFSNVLAVAGFLNSLVQTLIKFTSPGVPDIYQGNELWDFSLVDPDNRRSVDYDRRRKLLAEMEPALLSPANDHESNDDHRQDRAHGCCTYLRQCLENPEDGRLKMFVTSQILRYCRQFPELFMHGSYMALETTGSAREHVFAFARRYEDNWALVVAPLMVTTLLDGDDAEKFYQGSFLELCLQARTWKDTAVVLPEELAGLRLENLFSGEQMELDKLELQVSQVFRTFPLAFLAAAPATGESTIKRGASA